LDIYSQRIKEERNWCGALNVANGAMRSVQTNVETGLTISSAAMAVSTARVIYMEFLSNVSFQSGQTGCFFCIFSIQTI
jgi:hypothetical protein